MSAQATIQNPGDAWFWHEGHAYWKAADVWDHYFATVGRGTAFILNMPPDITGQIPESVFQLTSTSRVQRTQRRRWPLNRFLKALRCACVLSDLVAGT